MEDHVKRAIMLAGHKLFIDYRKAREVHGSVIEPEHFHDEWMKKNISRVSHEFRLSVWRHFMSKLKEARRVSNG